MPDAVYLGVTKGTCMSEKRAKPTMFRLTQENRERLETAQELGLEMTAVVNELLEKHFDSYVRDAAKAKMQRLQKILATSR